jgi:hypothetical protein
LRRGYKKSRRVEGGLRQEWPAPNSWKKGEGEEVSNKSVIIPQKYDINFYEMFLTQMLSNYFCIFNTS